jgi:phenylacetate-CoA ligase
MNLYQDVFFRSTDLLRGRKTIQRLNFLRKSQYWPSEKLRQWQLDRLNRILDQAKENSPFYRNRLKDLKLPISSFETLNSIPILTKQDLRDNFDSIKCTNIPNMRFVESKSGGSTGIPVRYCWDKHGMDWNRGSVYRSAEWADIALGQKTIQMTGSHFDFKEFQKFYWKMVFWLQRYKDLPVAVITPEILEEYYVEVCRYRPSSIWGYASALDKFAEYINAKHPETDFSFLRAIITSSETLRPNQRDRINSAFGGIKVFDHYGSREMYLASECSEHSGYHIHSEVIYMEVVDKNCQSLPPGELGRIIVTDLSNEAFPFIRFEMGDVGVLAEEKVCPCGLTLPMLSRMEGRIADMVVLKDRILTPPNFTILMSDFPGIDAYQICQESMETIKVLLVKGALYNETLKDYVFKGMQALVGPNVSIEINFVADIPVPPSGKRRFIVSSVASQSL